jgi:2-oxoisovalerate dehydrogenase E1 component alpha subunit
MATARTNKKKTTNTLGDLYSAPELAKLGLTQEDLLEIYSSMLLIRKLDERIWMMNRQGKAAIVASCQGHEAAQIGAVLALKTAPNAAYYPYYRDLAMLISAGVKPVETLYGFLAKQGEPFSGARQFANQGAIPDLGIFNFSNVVSTQVTHAVGYALACKITDDKTVTVTTFGDGGASQGEVHEGMNFAAIHKLPIIFLCENNKYAISVPISKQMAIEDIAIRGDAYGMPGIAVDGTDPLQVFKVMKEAVDRCLRGEGPTLIEAKVERYMPHTSDDDDTRYRDMAEVEEARKYDPLKLLKIKLMAKGILSEEQEQQFQNEATKEVNTATEIADAAPYPEIDDFYKHVYNEE